MTDPFISIYKCLYRRKIRFVLGQLSSKERKRQVASVYRQVQTDPFFKKASSVCIYSAFDFEFPTGDLIRSALRSGKHVFLPRVQLKTGLSIYEVRRISSDLVRGSYGIWEPNPEICRKTDPEKIDLWILPGIAFDEHGRRLGRGAGYFDRFFSAFPRAVKWAMAFQEQRLPTVPVDVHDVRMNRVYFP